MPVCIHCNDMLPDDCFNKSASKANGLVSYCKKCQVLVGGRWAQANRDRRKEQSRRYYMKCRMEAMQAYGAHCVCCGEASFDFLSIDHIDGSGSEHRKAGFGANIYLWLKNRGYPRDNFQVLCFNCNFAKRCGAECPHKLAVSKDPSAWTQLELPLFASEA